MEPLVLQGRGTLLLLLLVPRACWAHINALCVSTDPNDAGKATFHVGTYHTSTTGGNSICLSFNGGTESCFAYSNCYTIPSTTRTSTTALDAQILAYSGVGSSSAVTCYKQSGGSGVAVASSGQAIVATSWL
jgi:hypothetical protein